MKKSQLRQLIRECLKEVLDTDSPEAARAFAQIHKEKDIEGQSDFVKQYIQTALWSSTTGLEPSGGDPLDKQYTVDDIDHKTLIRMAKDAKDFQDKYGELYEKGGWDDEQAAHDFWLDRNGHGAGFKDRGYEYDAEEIGEELSKAAKSYGPYDLYLGDGAYDGILFGYPPG
jgi:hypothetical protein